MECFVYNWRILLGGAAPVPAPASARSPAACRTAARSARRCPAWTA